MAPSTHEIELRFGYGHDDVEALAERMGIAVSDAEIQAILANVDREIDGLARSATRTAIDGRIAGLLDVIRQAHAESDDD